MMTEILVLALLSGGGLLLIQFAQLRGAILDRDMGIDPED